MPRSRLSCTDPRYLGLAVGSAAFVLLAAWLSKDLPKGAPLRLLLAVGQAAATTLIIVLSLRGLRQLDELQRRIHLEALVLAFAGTAILVTGWGFLELAGAPEARWGLWLWPAMSALWATGIYFGRRRYR